MTPLDVGPGRPKPRSRVLFVNRFYAPDLSATSQILTDLAKALACDHWDVHVVTSRLRYDIVGDTLPRKESLEGVQVHRVWSTRFGRGSTVGRALDYLSFYVGCAWQLLRLLRRGDILVVKTDPPLLVVPCHAIARLRGAVLINWIQDLFPEVASAVGMRLLPERLVRSLTAWRNRAMSSAVCNVAIGSAMRDRLLGFGIEPSRIRVIPNWTDGSRIRPLAPDTNPLRLEWGIQDELVVAYSGNMGRAHEFETVLQAAAILNVRRDLKFVFIGAGRQLDAIRRTVETRSLSNVMFKPYQPTDLLPLSLAVADVHLVSLLPSLEGTVLPSKYYGILAAGRAVAFVGSRENELAREIVANGLGTAVEPGDAASLAQFLLACVNDRESVRSMGRNARQVFDSRYGREIAVARWQAVLQDAGVGSTAASVSASATG